ncbi:MAG: BofC C-terminal domain-containing protein [Thermosediminibacteraceae bacterium]|nr:BofC C-terminal domain-containing protein [Thermosediminibacteraceae bacterium]
MPKKILVALVIMVIITIGFIYGFYGIYSDYKNAQENRFSENTETIKLPEETIKPGAKIVYITKFRECGHEQRTESSIDEKYVGYTKARLQEEFKEWGIESFSSSKVVMTKLVDGICENHYYIGIYEGYVALFQGEPGKSSKVLEITDIKAGILKEEDRRLLEKGIIINSKDEFLKIREGLTH